MLDKFLLILELVVLVYLSFNILYILMYTFGAFFYRKTNFDVPVTHYNCFAILIPAYKSDDIITPTVIESLKQNYPRDYYDIVVIADSVKQETLDELNKFPVKLIPVKFDVSTKARSINTALALMPEKYDYCIVLDVDNIMEYDFLKKMNIRLQHGEQAIQGHRSAKNLNTSFAILDGLSEEINNYIFRKGHIGMGVSSALIGSGKAIEYKLFKDKMSQISTPVEDKELEILLLRDGVKILYEHDANVYDEKVQTSNVFANQRKRWIASQFFEFNRALFEGIYELVYRGNFDYFDKAIQKLLLPRVLLWGLVLLCSITVFFNVFHFGHLFFALFLLCNMIYIVAIPPSYFNMRTLMASLRIPQAFLLMIVAILRSKGAASKRFIHTPHQYLQTEENSNQ